MKNNTGLISGLIICLALAGYYGYLIYQNTRVLETDQNFSKPSATKLDETTLTTIRSKTLNGNLPITVTSDDLGNPQPLSNKP